MQISQNAKKCIISALLFALHLSLPAIKIENSTPAEMAVFAQFQAGTQAQTLTERLAAKTSATIELKKLPKSFYARDAAYSWTNTPTVTIDKDYQLASLNNATLKISEATPYKLNAPWNVKLELIFPEQKESKAKASDAAAQAEGRGDSKRSTAAQQEARSQETKEDIAEIQARIYDLAPNTVQIFNRLPNGRWMARQSDESAYLFNQDATAIVEMIGNDGTITTF